MVNEKLKILKMTTDIFFAKMENMYYNTKTMKYNCSHLKIH